MRFMKTITLCLLALSLASAPALAKTSRDHVSSHSAANKKNKKKAKAAKKTAKKKKNKAKASHAKKAKSSSHASTSHYPTQPGGSGFADMPHEKKDDLPPPAPAGNQ